MVAAVLTACTPQEALIQPAGHQAAEEAAVLAVMDAYMHEISDNDLGAMDARQTAEGMTYRHVAREDGGWDVVARSNKYWVAPERADEHSYRERYWSPTVMIRGAMAMVWAPYEFQTDGVTSHCGVDVFSFAKIDGVWKVSNSMWTVEPNACAELRPADASAIRPSD
jgi:hypothetical protein